MKRLSIAHLCTDSDFVCADVFPVFGKVLREVPELLRVEYEVFLVHIVCMDKRCKYYVHQPLLDSSFFVNRKANSTYHLLHLLSFLKEPLLKRESVIWNENENAHFGD